MRLYIIPYFSFLLFRAFSITFLFPVFIFPGFLMALFSTTFRFLPSLTLFNHCCNFVQASVYDNWCDSYNISSFYFFFYCEIPLFTLCLCFWCQLYIGHVSPGLFSKYIPFLMFFFIPSYSLKVSIILHLFPAPLM